MRLEMWKLITPVLGVLLASCGGSYGGGNSSTPDPMPTPAPAPAPTAYSQTTLVSDGSINSRNTDPSLKNPWGLAFAPGAPAWVANNGTQTSTLYDGTGNILPLIVVMPGGIRGRADITGVVSNTSTTDFVVTKGTVSGVARFVFSSESGTILGWSPTIDGAGGVIAYDDGNGGAVYKGLAIASDGASNFVFATDFHNNKVDVFDAHFARVTTAGAFADSTLPAGYAPFGIQAITASGSTLIYVTYAQKLADSNDNANGAGLGLVNVFDVHGTLQKHLITAGGKLNAPWGVALAPANFGTYSHELLVGNFGDGVINAFDPGTGAFVGALADSNGQPFANPGLWGIAFGNGARNQPTTTLYFVAGIANEADGVYGRIDLGATAPDTTAPTVAVSAPAASGPVSMPIQVAANATDDRGVTKVEFFASHGDMTTSIGSSVTAPYAVEWDPRTFAVGDVVNLTAVAEDAAGNETSSAGVVMIVAAP